MVEKGSAAPLEDFPLQPDARIESPRAVPEAPRTAETAAAAGPAPMGARLASAAADLAAILLLAAVAILGARLLTGQSPRPSGVLWALGFLVYLSFFATVPPLVLFGRTVGMAIGELTARSEGEAGIGAGAATRRWAGTLATAATAGLLLLWARQSPETPTPADRLSGRPLSLD